MKIDYSKQKYTVSNRAGFTLSEALSLWKTKYEDLKDFKKDVIIHESLEDFGKFVEDCWNDPLLPLSGKASFEDMEPRKQRPLLHHRFGGGSGVTSAETLKSRLGQIHERIRSGILTHPAAEQGPLLSIVASWARSVAASPLAPTIQRNAGGYPIVSPSVKEEEHVSSVPTAV